MIVNHKNENGNGSMLTVKIVDDMIKIDIAAQSRIMEHNEFVDADHATVYLDMFEAAELVEVLRGMCESLRDGKGIAHAGDVSRTCIKFCHRVDWRSGYEIVIDERSGVGDIINSIMLDMREAMVMMFALERAISILAI